MGKTNLALAARVTVVLLKLQGIAEWMSCYDPHGVSLNQDEIHGGQSMLVADLGEELREIRNELEGVKS